MKKRILNVYATIIVVWLTVPTLILIPISFGAGKSFNFPPSGLSLQWYEEVFTDPRWLEAIGNSLLVATLTMIVATVLGTAAAIGLSKVRFRGKGVLENLLLAPMIVPAIVTAIGVYAVFIKFGLLGTLFGFVVAHSVLAIPLVLINVAPSVQALDARLEDAAASLGAAPLTSFFSVTLPLILPGVTAGAVLAFVTSFDEVVLAIFIQDAGFRTLPVLIFQNVNKDSNPAVTAVAVLTMVVTAVLLLLMQRLARRQRRLLNP